MNANANVFLLVRRRLTRLHRTAPSVAGDEQDPAAASSQIQHRARAPGQAAAASHELLCRAVGIVDLSAVEGRASLSYEVSCNHG